ncbi:hypothetical protein M413DRAFT_27763 [Hebeloma cylindrosporum]|uniref:Uncharacterized protein n=1 Tax=Hebeloma cylindrosporum TaxID=76867 RepID=A0A0C3BXT5_HEBCY|nr:hypothetical protein M413DRAFT_27763 [Hebeloma cylindrosporum h7]
MPNFFPRHFIPYLQDNSPLPNDQLVEEAKKLRDDLVRKREALTAGFFDLQRLDRLQLQALTSRRNDVNRAVLQLYRILSPARYVPNDIWYIIFSFCRSESSRPGLNVSEAPLLLTRVCRGWKSIAIETPQLWSSIRVNIPTYQLSPEKLGWRRKMVKDWLGWSGILPLSISVNAQGSLAPPDCGVSDVIYISHFIRRIEHCPSRLHSLELSISKFQFLYDGFLALRVSDLPNLEEITVDKVPVNIMQGGQSVPWSDAGIFCAPKLRKISIGKLPKDSRESTWSIPPNWRGLRYLHIGGRLPPRQILQILVTLPDLIECHLKIANSMEIVNHTTRILMPNLKSFSLSEKIDSAYVTTSTFLYKYLDTPALKMFAFSARLSARAARSTPTINNPLLLLFPRIKPTRLVLKLDETLYHRWSLETFLAVPFIKYLVLHSPPQQNICKHTKSTKTLLDLKSTYRKRKDQGKPIDILPKLKTLEFGGEINILGDHLKDIIFKRLDPRDLKSHFGNL